jgi:para-nitrobenzyl esterase
VYPGSSDGSALHRFGPLILVGLISLLVPVQGWGQPLTVESGLIEGVQEGTVTVYKSVPYAAAPVDRLRWKSPQPPLPWSGVRQATTFGPICMQSGVSVPGAAAEPIGEDCLTLSIWTPAVTPRQRLPVMVWIPGGGFTQESGSMPLYWGDALARRGVIVVTVNYRVGVFGFLAHPELTRQSEHRSSGNYGLLDQIAALEWIKRNIAAFGGDAQRITAWGQSAGAMSISVLMASPLARGLFHRAIGHSGALFTPPEATGDPDRWYLKGAEARGLKFAETLGAESIDSLRTLPADRLLKAGREGTTHPIIDGYVLPKTPYDVFSSRQQQDVPLLIGWNADEARPLLAGRTVTLATFSDDIARAFGSDRLREIASAYLTLYPATTDAEARTSRAHFERDLRFGWDVWTWARLQARGGRAHVYYYYFAHAPPFPPGSPFSGWGAGHWQELRYAFDHLSQEPWSWSRADHALAEAMAIYWTNFAKKGNPNGERLPTWPRFTKDSERVMWLGSAIVAGDVPNLEGLRLFDDFYSRFRRGN